MKREIVFNKFRNLGFDHEEKLTINNSLEKGKLGNLVIIIGPNNSGKSNVLDGLYELGSGKLSDNDVTLLSYDNNDLNPKVSIQAEGYKYEVDKDGINISFKDYVEDNSDYDSYFNELANNLVEFYNFSSNDYYSSSFIAHIEKIRDIIKNSEISYLEKTKSFTEFLNLADRNHPHSNKRLADYADRYVSNYKSNLLTEAFKDGYKLTIKDYKKEINDSFREKYDIDLVPNIMKYKNENINNSSIRCTIDGLNQNSFLLSVLRKINIDKDKLINAYNISKLQNTTGPLVDMEKEINEALGSISNDFNDLYFADNDKYKFEIRLESNQIAFNIFRANRSMSLDLQSTGFRWFFNLYFNLLCGNTLNPGDIIIMDEPATNLHNQGQIELRKFLKEFAIKNDIVIIIATHIAQLIDIDYLDELRVVSMSDNISKIENDFTAINPDDPDSLKPIKESLTVGSYAFLNERNKLIFVEGITDYNYLIAMKMVLGIEGVNFLPIKGVGDVKKKGNASIQRNISKKLLSLVKYNPILIVDGDGAGNSMKKENADSDLEVIALTDIDPTFKEIENVFDPLDLDKLKLRAKNGQYIKKSVNSALIKTHAKKSDFSKKTLDNFNKIFNYILGN